jgi:S-adenosylmethionine:tRNA ribosyltransferase-isomerase
VAVSAATLRSLPPGAADVRGTTDVPPPPAPRVAREDVRMLVVHPRTRRLDVAPFATLAERLAPGDVLVVNDAATLPASLRGRDASGHPLEARLVEAPERGRARAVVVGAGDVRARTEDRPEPPPLPLGARISFGNAPALLQATLVDRSPRSPRLVELDFERDDAALWAALYAVGRPIQYAHRPEPLALWDVQTTYAARPWAVEMPSAGRPLTRDLLARATTRGVKVVALTHAAGLSSTGDAGLDAALPFPERYEIPEATAAAVAAARASGSGRVVAVGTSVVRALEAAALAGAGHVRPGPGVAEIMLDSRTRPRVVDGLVSGVHGPGESHYRLLAAFLDPALLAATWARATDAGLAAHELGDATLLLPSR